MHAGFHFVPNREAGNQSDKFRIWTCRKEGIDPLRRLKVNGRTNQCTEIRVSLRRRHSVAMLRG